MTIYEKLTQSPQTLAEFLKSLPVLDAPWDQAFQEKFCTRCREENCDNCLNEEYRNSPEWWLTQKTDNDSGRKCKECINYVPLKAGIRGGERGRCKLKNEDHRRGKAKACKRFKENESWK